MNRFVMRYFSTKSHLKQQLLDTASGIKDYNFRLYFTRRLQEDFAQMPE